MNSDWQDWADRRLTEAWNVMSSCVRASAVPAGIRLKVPTATRLNLFAHKYEQYLRSHLKEE